MLHELSIFCNRANLSVQHWVGFILPHLSQLEIKHLLYLSHPIPSMVSDEREACPEGNASRLNQACQVSGVVTSRR